MTLREFQNLKQLGMVGAMSHSTLIHSFRVAKPLYGD